MNTIPRILLPAVLPFVLAACGNKGPLVQASSAPASAPQTATIEDPALAADPATEAVSVEETEAAELPAPEPDPEVPVEEGDPVPDEDDGTP